MAKRTCEHSEGCDRPTVARGLCGKHYQREKSAGNLPPLRPKIKGTCLVVTGGKPCGRMTEARAMCTMHYTRWLRHGDPLIVQPDRPSNSEINYYAFHMRLRKARGRAPEYQCVLCGNSAYDWAYVHGTDARNFYSYVPMCHACHMAYDHKGRVHTPEARARMSAGRKRRWDQDRREGLRGTPLL